MSRDTCGSGSDEGHRTRLGSEAMTTISTFNSNPQARKRKSEERTKDWPVRGQKGEEVVVCLYGVAERRMLAVSQDRLVV